MGGAAAEAVVEVMAMSGVGGGLVIDRACRGHVSCSSSHELPVGSSWLNSRLVGVHPEGSILPFDEQYRSSRGSITPIASTLFSRSTLFLSTHNVDFHISITPIASTSGPLKVLSIRESHNLRESNSQKATTAVGCWRQWCGCGDEASGEVVAWFDGGDDGGAWRRAVVAVVSWDEGDEGGDEMMWRRPLLESCRNPAGKEGAAPESGGGRRCVCRVCINE
ncbi:hypothetical protein Tco_0688397 [Tanacetum coccineum]